MQRTTKKATPEDFGGDLFASWMRERVPHEARLRTLWAMTPAQRVSAMYRRELTFPQLAAWAAARPEEVPLLDGEFWFIAVDTPEAAEITQPGTDMRKRFEATIAASRKRKR
jgi:hypothetical protein